VTTLTPAKNATLPTGPPAGIHILLAGPVFSGVFFCRTDTVMAQHPLLQAALRAQQQGQPQQAATLYQRLLREQPGHPEGTLHYALLLAQSGQPAAALALLDPLAERFPDVPAVHINRAEILRRLGRFEEAI